MSLLSDKLKILLILTVFISLLTPVFGQQTLFSISQVQKDDDYNPELQLWQSPERDEYMDKFFDDQGKPKTVPTFSILDFLGGYQPVAFEVFCSGSSMANKIETQDYWCESGSDYDIIYYGASSGRCDEYPSNTNYATMWCGLDRIGYECEIKAYCHKPANNCQENNPNCVSACKEQWADDPYCYNGDIWDKYMDCSQGRWVPKRYKSCASGTSCHINTKECETAFVCSEGDTKNYRCVGNILVADRCLNGQWAPSVTVDYCSATEICDASARDCTSKCSEGDIKDRYCDSDVLTQEYYTICSGGNWFNTVNSCPIGKTCVNDRCSDTGPTCIDTCIRGTSTCAGEWYKAVCDDWDNDGCAEGPETNQLIHCPQGCENGECLTVTCPTGDTGYPSCNGDNSKIVQSYNTQSGTQCITSERTIKICPSGTKCVQQGTGANAAQCISSQCPQVPSDECSGDRTGLLKHSYSPYPECRLSENYIPCPTSMLCQNAKCGAEPIPIPDPTGACAIDTTADPYKVKYGTTTQSVFQSLFQPFSIITVSPISKQVNLNEPVIVRLRQDVNSDCDNPFIKVIGKGPYVYVENERKLASSVDPTQLENTDVNINIQSQLIVKVPLENNKGEIAIFRPEICAGGNIPVEYSVQFSFVSSGEFDIEAQLVCDYPKELIVELQSIEGITGSTIDTSDFEFSGEIVELTLSDKDSLTVTVGDDYYVAPTEDRCEACGEGFFNFCDATECYSLGACLYQPGFLGIFGRKCVQSEDLYIQCRSDSDCPGKREIWTHRLSGQ